MPYRILTTHIKQYFKAYPFIITYFQRYISDTIKIGRLINSERIYRFWP